MIGAVGLQVPKSINYEKLAFKQAETNTSNLNKSDNFSDTFKSNSKNRSDVSFNAGASAALMASKNSVHAAAAYATNMRNAHPANGSVSQVIANNTTAINETLNQAVNHSQTLSQLVDNSHTLGPIGTALLFIGITIAIFTLGMFQAVRK